MANGEGYFYQLFDNSKTVITVDTSTLLKHNSSLKFSGFKDGSYILTVGNNNNEEGRRENIEEQRKIVNRFHPLG